MLFGAISHSIVFLRIFALWDQRKNIARVLMGMFAVCIVATTAIGIVCVQELKPQFRFSEIFATCILLSKPKILIMVFGVQSFFDVLIICISVYNALERPHRSNAEVITSLQNDGLKFLVALFALRTLYLISSIVGNGSVLPS
ncbi:hypothetical protein B0H10DRAFT_2235144 [Mycena sp. CBHHK59/15]|nr:hypothetical protein B0H10DRAFT_2235144 [Mycena sp. CBHHK59/15]